MEQSTTALNSGGGHSVWTLGVGTVDGPRALTWKVPCALMVAADTDGRSQIVV